MEEPTRTERQKRNLDIALSKFGLGDIGSPENPSVWFMGIEEGQVWDQDFLNEAHKDHRREGKGWVAPMSEEPDWNVAGCISKVAVKLTRDRVRKTSGSWKHYRQCAALRAGCGVCATNIFPIGKKSHASWPDSYGELFGLEARHRDWYKDKVRDERFELIRRKREDHKPQAIVCFGKTVWSEFKRLFELGNGIQEGRIRRYDEERILLTHFFYNGAGNDMFESVASILDEWGVSIP